MIIYVFGNVDDPADNKVLKILPMLKLDFPNIKFEIVKPNEDLPFAGKNLVYIIDTLMGIDTPEIITTNDLDKIVLPPRNSVHDFDLGFQLRYLIKIGKLDTFKIIGVPYDVEIDEQSYKNIKKLIAQL